MRHGKQEVADGFGCASLAEKVAQGEVIARGLRHLLSVDQEVLTVHPIAGKCLAAEGFGLCNLILVMRKNEVGPSGVNVEGLAQVLGSHHRTLDVPARPARTYFAFPERLPGLGGLPQDKIADVGLLVFVAFDPGARPHSRKIDLGKLAV
jgi:hypothetical protein